MSTNPRACPTPVSPTTLHRSKADELLAAIQGVLWRDCDIVTTWVIRHVDYDNAGTLSESYKHVYWSVAAGHWVARDQATEFNDHEKEAFELPSAYAGCTYLWVDEELDEEYWDAEKQRDSTAQLDAIYELMAGAGLRPDERR